jgi:deazaflavin-dependent oxidoreductase (nitroreductase family)
MSVLRRIAGRLGHWRWFGAIARPLVPIDRLIGRLSRGRLVALGLAPALILTTTGRRSGRPRRSPLLYVRDGPAFVVVGTNWGQVHPPAWSLNLLADPQATVAVGGWQIRVRASVVTGPERDRLWRLLVRQWPPYDTYPTTAGGRQIHLFRLDPAEEPPTAGTA